MKKYLLILGVLFTLSAFAGDKGTWTGFISDAHCGAKGNNEGHSDCAKKCVKEGHAPVFVVGDKVYAISDVKKAVKYAGDKVTITGTITGDTIDIEKISK